MPRTKAVVKSNNNLPAYMQGKNQDCGTENIESDDIVIPRIKICQGLSKIKKVLDIEDGELYNSVSNENYGPKLNFWILLFWKSMVWFSDDFKLRGTIYKDIDTGQEIKFGNEIAYCEENYADGRDSYNYMIITERELLESVKDKSIPFPAVVSFMSAALSPAKQLNGKLKTNSFKKPPLPIYGQMITITTNLKTFTKGEAFIPIFSYKRFPEEKEYYVLKELYKNCRILQRKASAVASEEEDIDHNTGQNVPKKTPY